MKALILTLASLAILDAASHAQRGERRLSFDNRSSVTVIVCRCTSPGNFEARQTLAPGDAFVTAAEDGQLWTVATPYHYRPVESVTVGGGWGSRRVVISDNDIDAIGTTRLRLKIDNHTGRDVELSKVVAGEEVPWSRMKVGRVRHFYSYQRREWVVRDAATMAELDRFWVGGRSETVVLKSARAHDHSDHARGGAWGREAPAPPVTMTITNQSHRKLSVLKRTALGSRTVGTLGAHRSASVETEPGAIWRIEDAETLDVLDTVTVPRGRQEFTVTIERTAARERPVPPAKRGVTVRIYNDTPERIDVHKRKDGSFKHAKRINPGRFYDFDLFSGQEVSVRSPETGRELESFRAPQGDQVYRVRAHGDHAHVDVPPERGADSDPVSQPVVEEEPASGPPRPRELLRRLFGRE